MLAELAAMNADIGDEPCGPLGAVVGATRSASTFDLALLSGPYLIPGVGAQGGTAKDVAERFAGVDPRMLLVNQSRSIASAGPGIDSLRTKALHERDELARALRLP